MSDNKNIDTNSRNFSKLKEVIKKIWESKERKDATEIASKINTTDLIEIGYYNLVGSEDDTLLDKTSKKSVANLIDYTVTNGAKAINLDALKNVDALKNMPELGTLGKNLTIINNISIASKFITTSDKSDEYMKTMDRIATLKEQLKNVENDEEKIREINSEILKLNKKADDLLVDTGKDFLSTSSASVGNVPVIGLAYSVIIARLSDVFESISVQIIDHKRQVEEAVKYLENIINATGNGKVTDDDIKKLLSSSRLTAEQYKQLKAIEQSHIIDLIEDESEKKKYEDRIASIKKLWYEDNATIEKLNRILEKLGDTDGQWERDDIHDVNGYTMENGIKKVRDGRENAKQSYDPLLIDLENNGFDTKNLQDGVYFDLDGNMTKEKTSWADKQDALLAIDLDNNGTIDNGAELFGDNFQLADNTFSKSSIQAISTLDTNKDGKIDKQDNDFSKIFVWQDVNHDGYSQKEELKQLSDLNIQSIDVSNIQSRNSRINDLTLKNTLTYTKVENGKETTGQIGEFLLNKDNIDVKDDDIISKIIPQTEEEKNLINTIKELPNVRAFGKAKTLHNLMYLDKTGTFIQLVQDFANAKSTNEKDEIVEKILIKMTESENIDENSRGSYINAKYVNILETFLDEKLQQGQLNERTAQFYKDSYNDIKLMYYSELSLQTTFKNSKSLFNIKDNHLINISLLNNYTMLRMIQDPINSDDILKETSRVLMYLSDIGVKGFREFKEFFAVLNPIYLETIAKSNTKIYSLTDKSESQYLYANNSTIFAGDGNDNVTGTFNGHSGNDYFFGEKGNDTLSGGIGDDTYFFELGDGQDTIYESSNQNDFNSIVFGKGITKENIEIRRLNQSDIVLEIKNTTDKIVIKGQIGTNPAINKIYFENGQTLTSEELRNIANTITTKSNYIEGTQESDMIDLLQGDDTLYSKDGDDIINGNEGNDTIYSENGNDTIYGDDGDDKIYSGYGDDIISGGKGNDALDGSYGNDTYIFHTGDGQDTISEYDSSSTNLDKIQLDNNIKEEEIILKRTGDNLEITFKDNQEDKIIMNNQFSSMYYTIEEIHYGENGVINFQEMLNKTNGESIKQNALKGSYTDDTLIGTEKDDTIISYDGNDIITAGKGNDKIDGGYGNDKYYYNLGDGTDTITDSSGTDTLVFGEGITKEDIEFNRISSSDIAINFKNSQDRIILKEQYNNDIIDKIIFEDGSSLKGKEIREISNVPTQRDDYLAGTSDDDILEAKEGNDTISAGYGNDTIICGKGNDYLQGHYGADTYIFSRGDGQDIVDENNSDGSHSVVDKIVFTDINREDVYFTKENSSDITIKVKDSEDKITIKNAHSNDWQVEEIHFANGEVLTYKELMKKPFEYYGDEKDNTITGYTSNSILYGKNGNDKLQGQSGSDILIGGQGSDTLNGSYGSDTYIFNKDDGQDIISDYDSDTSNKDKIELGTNVLNTIFKKDGNNLNISFADSQDSITVNNWYSGSSYQIEEIKDTTGNIITNQKVNMLIDYMSGFETQNGMIWSNMAKNNDNDLKNILDNFWVKQA